jgi:branched-subunit amino acid transport protein AzlD
MNRNLAQIFSVLGHPMLVLTYVLLLMMAINPYAFGVRHLGEQRAVVLLFSVFSTSFLIPAVGVAMMKPLGLIKSLQMYDKQERIGPYIVTGVFYLWLFKNLLSAGQTPPLLAKFVLGATIGLFLSFFINIFTKISAHAAGMGGLIAMLVILAFNWGNMALGLSLFGGTLEFSLLPVLALAVVAAGLVGTARLALGAHVPADLYRGYAIGIAAVVIAQMVL